jgi:hypothetical protein
MNVAMLSLPGAMRGLSFDIVCGLRAGRPKGQQPVNGHPERVLLAVLATARDGGGR